MWYYRTYGHMLDTNMKLICNDVFALPWQLFSLRIDRDKLLSNCSQESMSVILLQCFPMLN